MDGHPEMLERRRFLSLSLAGAAGAATLPVWLAKGFGDPGPGQGGGALGAAERLARGFDEAHRAGQPLLVLLVPEDAAARYQAGNAWGQLLTHASDEALADLAVCVVVCAPEALVREVLGSRATLPDDLGRAVLVETDGRVAVPIAAAGAWEGFEGGLDDGWERYEVEHTAFVRERVARLEAELHGAIFPEWNDYDRRMQACAAALGLDAGRVESEGFAATGRSLERAAAEAPAIVRWEVGRYRMIRRVEGIEALSHATSKRLRIDAPAGSRWMQDHGCAAQPEVDVPCPPGQDCARVMVACGMGHVPEVAARFLELFTS